MNETVKYVKNNEDIYRSSIDATALNDEYHDDHDTAVSQFNEIGKHFKYFAIIERDDQVIQHDDRCELNLVVDSRYIGNVMFSDNEDFIYDSVFTCNALSDFECNSDIEYFGSPDELVSAGFDKDDDSEIFDQLESNDFIWVNRNNKDEIYYSSNEVIKEFLFADLKGTIEMDKTRYLW